MTAPDRLAQTINNPLAKRRRPHMTLPSQVQITLSSAREAGFSNKFAMLFGQDFTPATSG